MSHRSGVSVLRDHDGTIVFDDREKAEKFNKYFASVGIADNGVSPRYAIMFVEMMLNLILFSSPRKMS